VNEKAWTLLLVAAGGALGSVTRFLMSSWLATKSGVLWPIGTFTVNVAGCFLIGVLTSVLALKGGEHGTLIRHAVGTGFLGGFTTFSAYVLESSNLLSENRLLTMAIYISASVLFGLIAMRAGAAITMRLIPA